MTVQNLLTETIATGNIDTFDAIFTINVIDHDPLRGQQAGVEGLKESYRKLRLAFHYINITIERTIADERNVCIAYTLTGVHSGVYQGIEPTNKPISVRGVKVSRFENGMIAERWGSINEYSIVDQLKKGAVGPLLSPTFTTAKSPSLV